jgi:hypothetical protein
MTKMYMRGGVYFGTAEDMIDRIEELEAKLAKAVEAFDCWHRMMDSPAYDLGEMVSEFDAIVSTTLAELKGGK